MPIPTRFYTVLLFTVLNHDSIMEEPDKKRIELPLEVDIHTESHEERYEQSYKDSLDSNVYLPYDILRIVFRYLNGKDLSSVAMVSRSWLEAANNEKCLRGPHCFVRRFICAPDCELSFNCIKDESTIKPSTAFFFLPWIVDAKVYNIVKGCICESLPKNCEAIILFADTIILNNDYLSNPSSNMLCVLFPQIPNVEISIFEVTGRKSQERNKYTEYLQMIIEGTSKLDHETSMCLMLFCNLSGFSMGLQMYSLAQSRFRNDEKIVLCDLVVHRVATNNEKFIKYCGPYCVALLITGSIQTWSVAWDRKYKTREQVEEKLKLFKQQVKLQKHSVGFVFGCRSAFSEYDLKNKETMILLKRSFPEVPLVGCFRRGELERDPTSVHQRLWYNFSIMFIILTYG